MKLVKKTAEYTIFLRNDKRYAVRSASRTWINGDEKVSILQKEELLKTPEPKAEAPAEEASEASEASE
ncbi:hypothetical protein [Agarilytica rhodophyticola]|uniref:hypothetical protein n=1 Tax=Agarilytica rhodophyticola TaxID=1737490 RepID=UPI000B346477|nr:hypothetical protein [Agarilytica rhodophyticola]